MVDKPTILIKANTELFCYKGRQIETDRKDNKRKDNVLPIYSGSGVHYLLDHLLVQEGDVALDLCTGSGILGIYVAEKASKVIATDISPRALKFAKRNAERNKIKNIEFGLGDLFEPVKGEQFDYIITNPPFVPIPVSVESALHSNGGEDGLYFVRKILEKAETYLKPNGRIQIYSLSLGDEKTTLLEELLRKNLRKNRVTITNMYLNSLPLEEFVKDFKKYAGVEGWYQKMKSEGLTHLHSFIVNIEPSASLTILKKTIPEIERTLYSDNWENWKGRFSYWVLGRSNFCEADYMSQRDSARGLPFVFVS